MPGLQLEIEVGAAPAPIQGLGRRTDPEPQGLEFCDVVGTREHVRVPGDEKIFPVHEQHRSKLNDLPLATHPYSLGVS